MNARSSDFQMMPNLPNGEVAVNPSQNVKMYFIGVKVMRPVFKKKTITAKDGRKINLDTDEQIGWTPPVVVASGRAIQLPPIGEFLVISHIKFNEIRERLRFPQNNIIYEGVTTDPTLALAIKRAYDAAGQDPTKVGDVNYASISAAVSLENMSDALLIAELERRAAMTALTGEPEVPQTTPVGEQASPATVSKKGK